MQRDSSAAYQLLVAARQGHAPQRPVERLALLQLLIQLHRQSHERTGETRLLGFYKSTALLCIICETNLELCAGRDIMQQQQQQPYQCTFKG